MGQTLVLDSLSKDGEVSHTFAPGDRAYPTSTTSRTASEGHLCVLYDAQTLLITPCVREEFVLSMHWSMNHDDGAYSMLYRNAVIFSDSRSLTGVREEDTLRSDGDGRVSRIKDKEMTTAWVQVV